MPSSLRPVRLVWPLQAPPKESVVSSYRGCYIQVFAAFLFVSAREWMFHDSIHEVDLDGKCSRNRISGPQVRDGGLEV